MISKVFYCKSFSIQKFFLQITKSKNFLQITKLKIFSHCFVVNKNIFFNDVIINNFEIVNFFVKIVEKFFVLWNDIEFVKLSKKNWMRIFLKSNWKIKIINKIKIYFFDVKNQQLIDDIFDKFYRIEKFV